MKKRVIKCLVLVLLSSLSSCNDEWNDVEVQKSPKIHSFEQDLEIIKSYMTIDTINNCFNVIIADSAIQANNISENNLSQILDDIDELNKEIKASIAKGEVTTLCLSSSKTFHSYTVNKTDNLCFADSLTKVGRLDTRASLLGYMRFSQGNWRVSSADFVGSDHVTSTFYVDESRGRWQVSFRCYTGTSSYGNVFTTYGTGYTHGGIKRYWWYTGKAQTIQWSFSSNSPVGGEASGGVDFVNTY